VKLRRYMAFFVAVVLVLTVFVPVVSAGTGSSVQDGSQVAPPGPPLYKGIVRFAVMGDTRPYVGGDPVPAVTKRIFEELKWIHPDFVAHTGDIIMGSSTNEGDTYVEFLNYMNFIRDMGVPLYAVPGNHDLYPDGVWDHIWGEMFGPHYYYFDYQGARFIFMDTELYEGDMQVIGGFPEGEIDWLKNLLDDAQQKNMPVFVFMHRPLYVQKYDGTCVPNDESGSRAFQGNEEQRDEVINLLNSHSVVKYVFSGHKHMYYYCHPEGGPAYVTVGNGGAPLYGSHWRGAWYGYIIVYYEPDTGEAYFDIYQPYHNAFWKLMTPEYAPTQTMLLGERLYGSAKKPTAYGAARFYMPQASSYDVKPSFGTTAEIVSTRPMPDGSTEVVVKTYPKEFELGSLEGYKVTLKAVDLNKNWKPKRLVPTDIRLEVNGEKFACPVPLRVVDGRLMVPIQCFDEDFLGLYPGGWWNPPMKMKYEPRFERVWWKRGRGKEYYVWYRIDSWISRGEYKTDGKPFQFITSDDMYAIRRDGHGEYGYIWVRDLAKIMGEDVVWNPKTRTVVIK